MCEYVDAKSLCDFNQWICFLIWAFGHQLVLIVGKQVDQVMIERYLDKLKVMRIFAAYFLSYVNDISQLLDVHLFELFR